jgi:hypothetical protein
VSQEEWCQEPFFRGFMVAKARIALFCKRFGQKVPDTFSSARLLIYFLFYPDLLDNGNIPHKLNIVSRLEQTSFLMCRPGVHRCVI